MEDKKEIKVLLVEDDEDLLMITSRQIEENGYVVIGTRTGEETIKILETQKIDVILLDVMLPDCDGHELCRKIRSDEVGYDGPIIFLSCLGDGENIVEAFREGGTDYIVKPAKAETLKERIEINLNKFQNQEIHRRKRWYRHFMIDQGRHEVFRVQNGVQGEKIILSPKEYQLLETLVEHEGEVLLYRQMYRDIWGQDDLDDVRTLMVHVSNLRKKLAVENMDIIRAIRGVGYLFQDE